jgi:hypothetical protein
MKEQEQSDEEWVRPLLEVDVGDMGVATDAGVRASRHDPPDGLLNHGECCRVELTDQG